MKRSFVLGALLASVAGLVFATPAVLAQTGTAQESGGYQSSAGRQYGISNQPSGSSPYRQQTGPYARQLGYGHFGTYGSPYIPGYSYRGSRFLNRATGTYYYGVQQYRSPSGYAYSGYPQYSYRAQPGWRGRYSRPQACRGYYGKYCYPGYRQSAYGQPGRYALQGRCGYYRCQPGWSGRTAWQCRGQRPCGYYSEQQSIMNRAGYFVGGNYGAYTREQGNR